MKRIIGIITSCVIVPFALSCSGGKTAEENYVKASEGVLTRTMGKLENVSLQMSPKTAEGLDRYEIEATGGHLTLKGSSPSAICYAMDKYLRDACGSMICWSGSKLNIPQEWPDWKEEWINTPYHSNTKPFDSPLEVAKELIANEK